jgi:glycosyltransferase involved in cell wall biosynthesis
MVEMLKISEFILFVGWVDYMLFPTYISLANVCIIPQPSNPFIDTTMPNKIYEYMAMGKPVLTSDAIPLKRVIQECQCGETFKSNSATDFYKMLLKIKKSRKPYGVNGKRAVEKKYNWVISSRTLRRLYRNLEKE